MILHKFWSAFMAQINKVANIFWEADPVAQMRYEYDRPSSSSRKGASASSSTAAWSSASPARSLANRSHVQKLEAADQGLPEGRRSHDRGEVRARAAEGQGGARRPTSSSCRCTRPPTATASRRSSTPTRS